MSDVGQEEKTWGMGAHVAALAFFVIPFVGNVLGPLVVWLMKKDVMPFVADQGREALNFNLTVTIAAVIGWVLTLVTIGFLVLAIVFALWLVLTLMAIMESNKGIAYRYPFTLRLIK